MPTKILLIDDDRALADLLKDYFLRYELTLISAARPSEGLMKLEREHPEAIILDVMLPEKDGFDVCRDIRHISDIPILMLTARGELSDCVVGLELGADDYLAKPFEPRELVARIQSLLRRSKMAGGKKENVKSLHFDDLRINLDTQEVFLKDKSIMLTTSEYQLLVLLARHPNQLYSRDDIMNSLKGIEVEMFSRAIDITVSRLRQKLKRKNTRVFIKTVWGRGYTFVGQPGGEV